VRLQDIAARAYPGGNRIDLRWTNPAAAQFPGVRVVRREGTHPTSPTDGTVVAHGVGLLAARDIGLKGETVYYYSLFPFHDDPPQYDQDRHNRVAAMATAPYDFAGLMYALLPALYHRYDEAQPPSAASVLTPEDQAKGQLRRYLDLPGAQFDQIYSLARAALNFHNVGRVDGSLLPLLAQWIGWSTDYSREVGAQRNEIRFAPQIYQTIGLIPAVEETVKRITSWESRTKEYVHNVARTNEPERLNLWSMLRDGGGTFGTAALASVNFAYEGRPSAVRESDGALSFFYHTQRRDGWDIWTKRFAGGQWQPSTPVVDHAGIDKHPAAAIQDNRLWLFWENYNPAPSGSDAKWQIRVRTRTGNSLSSSTVFGSSSTSRRMPAAAVDATGGLWLFWSEQTALGWSIKYNRHDGAQWLANPVDLPADAGVDPRVESDLRVVVHPTSVNQRIWLFWSRHEPGASAGQTRWTVAWRIKQGFDPAAADWSVVRTLPKAAASDHDREPSPVFAAGGNVELFWASSRKGGWTLWRAVLDIGTLTWGAPQQLTNTPYSNRAPVAADIGAGTLLVYRSNESLAYRSAVYGATKTLDTRYGGTTTVDTRNSAKLALRGKFEDFQHYIQDSGNNGARTNDDRIARDTIGLFLTPAAGADAATIQATISRLANVLAAFMPITQRAVFITP
jgi:hypothetical protein